MENKRNHLKYSIDNILIKIEVNGNFQEFENLKNNCNKSINLGNWNKKILNLDGISIFLNIKSIQFYIMGIGNSINEAKIDAKNNAIEVRNNLINTFNLKLKNIQIFDKNG